jgi:serpin (serine protease inhibitor)
MIGNMPPENTLIILSALYFNGRWVNSFYKDDTNNTFHLMKNRRTNALFMTDQGHFQYVSDGELEAVRLPYSGDVSMLLFLHCWERCANNSPAMDPPVAGAVMALVVLLTPFRQMYDLWHRVIADIV